jgi:lipid-binding SYLF domain-containing protein
MEANMRLRLLSPCGALVNLALVLTVATLGLGGCTTTTRPTVTNSSENTSGSRHREISANADATLDRLYKTVPDARELVAKSNGVLIFPSAISAGLGIGGQYGEGVLRVRGVAQDYYSLASLSVGLQIGAQSKSMIFLFMTQDALDKFRRSEGWSIGADASVAVIKVGANGGIDVNSAQAPIVAFVLTNAGLMANLTLEGTKITRMKS